MGQSKKRRAVGPCGRVPITPEDEIGPAVQTLLLIDCLAVRVFPELVLAPHGEAGLTAIGKGLAFLAVSPQHWLGRYAPVLPRPACLLAPETAVLACWTDLPVRSQKP